MEPGPIRLPAAQPSPWRRLALRLSFAVGLIVFVAIVAWLGRSGYTDGDDGGAVSFLDALYYASVSVTTTGYGDITPVTDTTRALTVLLITPARILFLILLVGTTVEILTTQSLERLRLDRWRRTLEDHVIICGFGTKGRTAARTLRDQGVDPGRIVVVDPDAARIDEAIRSGFAGILGDARRTEVLREAGIEKAKRVVVAVDADDAAVLVTLTAREHNEGAKIVAAAREDENAHLLHQSGADAVVRTASAAGRMLGMGSRSPQLVDVLEDLTTIGQGLDLFERPVEASECGREGRPIRGESVIAVLRDGTTYRWDDAQVEVLQAGDRLVCLRSHHD